MFHHVLLISCACCFNCSTGLLHEERRETEKIHDFLIGINLEYHSRLCTQILSVDPLPSLNRTYQLVIQDERVQLATFVPPLPE